MILSPLPFEANTRRALMDFTSGLETTNNSSTRRRMITGVSMILGGLVALPIRIYAGPGDEISHTAESIHQEVTFTASRKRVYAALTDAKQFERVVQLSDAKKKMMPAGGPPAQISPDAGGTFSTFGGLIVGRNIELVPDVRIVQAWRPAYWEPGVYSIVKFELADSGTGTLLTLDHKAFPNGDSKSLLDGWNKNYWEPLAKYLA
jgi:uncharacterized protein YndB with AHSA1/START domain